MSKASGLVLILSGLAVAAFVLPQGDDPGEPESLSQQTEVAKKDADLAGAAIVAPQPRLAFRPTAPVPAPAVTPGPARATEAGSAFSAPVVVTLAPRQSEPALPPPQRVAIPRDRDSLARELQKELRRVGCYDGELNGAWTPSTRRAMKAFTDRINASLPVEEPDAILYAMVQGQRDQVCGKPCPAGQGLSEDGRCQPSAILAKARKGPVPAAVAQMPKPVAPVATEKPAPVISGWSTTSTAAAPAPTPPLAAATPPLGGVPTEGRMALAGPPGPGEAIATGPVTGAEPAALPAAPVAAPRKQATTAVGPARSRDWSRNIFNPN